MRLLSIKLENCYGIASLEHVFDFKKSNAVLVYAPNGVMKTSFAKTFKKLSEGQQPKEELYNRPSSFEVSIDGTEIRKENILVVEPFNSRYESENLSALLVNSEKKARYDEVFRQIATTKAKLITILNERSKIKKADVEKQLNKDFGCKNIFEAAKILSEVEFGSKELAKVKYQKIFDSKVLDLLASPSIQENIGSYTDRYNKLIETSPVFKKSVFNPAKASAVIKALKKEKFFEADHKVLLNGHPSHVTTHKDFEEKIRMEKARILNDDTLQEISEKIVGGVASVKSFQDLLEESPEVASELNDLNKLRKVLWASYFQESREQFEELLSLYEENKAELAEIEEAAQLEETLWYQAHSTFMERFHVPFSMRIENHTNAILGTTAPNVVFAFDGEDGEPLCFNRGQLETLDTLSLGERRAMYLLYIIFEFHARLSKGEDTVVVIDDIADSFDYKNKYAIIEYLKELAEETSLRLIVLTHNFDFYRTFQSRVLASAQWENSFVAQKNEQAVKLLKGGSKNVANPFEQWKNGCKSDSAMLIAMVPFIRNLVEYRDGNSCDAYSKLTSMLHIKQELPSLKIADLESIISNVVSGVVLDDCFDPQELVLIHIYKTADSLCAEVEEEICLEKKVTLSIAIRLKAEEFMWSQVNDQTPFSKYQTNKLYKRLLKENESNSDSRFLNVKTLLSRVMLMTSENIHINSFMYEPLMDMSCHHLVSLYDDIKALR